MKRAKVIGPDRWISSLMASTTFRVAPDGGPEGRFTRGRLAVESTIGRPFPELAYNRTDAPYGKPYISPRLRYQRTPRVGNKVEDM